MAIRKQSIIAVGFAIAGVVSLVAGVLPAFRGRALNVIFLGVGAFWLLFSIAVWRKPDDSASA